MFARELESNMNYPGMERDARKILVDEKLATTDKVAIMTCIDVCDKILEYYEVVSCE